MLVRCGHPPGRRRVRGGLWRGGRVRLVASSACNSPLHCIRFFSPRVGGRAHGPLPAGIACRDSSRTDVAMHISIAADRQRRATRRRGGGTCARGGRQRRRCRPPRSRLVAHPAPDSARCPLRRTVEGIVFDTSCVGHDVGVHAPITFNRVPTRRVEGPGSADVPFKREVQGVQRLAWAPLPHQ